MNINATLFVQILTFAVLVWLMKRLLWVPITQLMSARRQRVADGLAATEKGAYELELAGRRAREVQAQARAEADRVIARAERLAAELAEAVRAQARAGAERLVHAAKVEIEQEFRRVHDELHSATGGLAAAAAVRILDTAAAARPEARKPH